MKKNNLCLVLSLMALGLSVFALAINPRVQNRLGWEWDNLAYFSLEQFWPYGLSDDLKTYDLSMAPGDLGRLEADRRSYQQTRPRKKLKVSGVLKTGDRKIPVKVTYQGDADLHWTPTRKSLRVDAGKGYLMDGMQTVNFIVPEARHWLNDAFSKYLAGKLGLTVSRWDFVHLKINGEEKGVYYLMEQWERTAMTLRGYPDAMLLGEEDLADTVGQQPLYENAALFRTIGKWEKGSPAFNTPLQMLLKVFHEPSDRAFARDIRELVDWDNFCRWQAHQILLNSRHQDSFHNNRLLWNTTLGKFQFLPVDLLFGAWQSDWIEATGHPLVARAACDPSLRNDRDKILWSYVQDEANLKRGLAYFDALYEKTKRAFWADDLKTVSNASFNRAYGESRKLYERRFRMLAEALKNCDVFYTINRKSDVVASLTLGTASFASARLKRCRVILKNSPDAWKPLALEVYQETGSDNTFGPDDTLVARLHPEAEPSVLGGDVQALIAAHLQTAHGSESPWEATYFTRQFQNTKFYIVAKDTDHHRLKIRDIHLEIVNAVTGEPARTKGAYANTGSFGRWEERLLSPEDFLRLHPFLIKDAKDASLLIWPAGKYLLQEDLIVPRGVRLRLLPGVVLRLQRDVSILSWGTIQAAGRVDLPVVFRAQSPGRPWGVVALIDQSSQTQSEFRHCVFLRGGKGVKHGIERQGMEFSGTLSCFGGKMLVSKSRFLDNTGEDAVHGRHAIVTVQDCMFRHNRGDAIDFDYVKNGQVKGNIFLNNGNDGIDLAGSRVWMEDNRLYGSRDKAISVGEGSHGIIRNCLIQACATGVAVKDASRADIEDCAFHGNGVALNLFRKDYIYQTGGFTTLKNCTVADNRANITKDALSSVEGSFRDIRQDMAGKGDSIMLSVPTWHDP